MYGVDEPENARFGAKKRSGKPLSAYCSVRLFYLVTGDRLPRLHFFYFTFQSVEIVLDLLRKIRELAVKFLDPFDLVFPVGLVDL